jgi:hypothetical protein
MEDKTTNTNSVLGCIIIAFVILLALSPIAISSVITNKEFNEYRHQMLDTYVSKDILRKADTLDLTKDKSPIEFKKYKLVDKSYWEHCAIVKIRNKSDKSIAKIYLTPLFYNTIGEDVGVNHSIYEKFYVTYTIMGVIKPNEVNDVYILPYVPRHLFVKYMDFKEIAIEYMDGSVEYIKQKDIPLIRGYDDSRLKL